MGNESKFYVGFVRESNHSIRILTFKAKAEQDEAERPLGTGLSETARK